MRLIPNWRQAWRFWSMQAAAAKSSLIVAYLALPGKLQDALPPKLVLGLAVVATVLGVMGARVLDQTPRQDDHDHDA